MNKLQEAAGWIIASFRGNNDCSDDKAIHRAIDCLCKHYGWGLIEGRSSVRKRLDSLVRLQDDLTPLGRAVLWGCFALREEDLDDLYGVGGAWSIWKLLSEAERLEGLRD